MKDRDRRRDRMKTNEIRRYRMRPWVDGGHNDAHLWKKDRRKQRQFKRMVLMLTIPVLLLASACGQPSGAGETDGGKGKSSGTPETNKDEQDAFLEFAKCMREHGVNMPDPEFKGSGEVSAIRIGGPDVSPEEMQDAEKACRKHLPQSASRAGPKLSEQDQDAFLAFAKCMRENGVNHPDPKPGDGGLTFKKGDSDSPDPESAEFQEAEKVCRKHLAPLDRKIDKERA